jgi:hypothetical protein
MAANATGEARLNTLHQQLKSAIARVAKLETQTPPKRQKIAGSGHLSLHDLQKANLISRLGGILRPDMRRSEEGDEAFAENDPRLAVDFGSYFDASQGMTACVCGLLVLVLCLTVCVLGVKEGDNPLFLRAATTRLLDLAKKEGWYTHANNSALELDALGLAQHVKVAFASAAKTLRAVYKRESKGADAVAVAKVHVCACMFAFSVMLLTCVPTSDGGEVSLRAAEVVEAGPGRLAGGGDRKDVD